MLKDKCMTTPLLTRTSTSAPTAPNLDSQAETGTTTEAKKSTTLLSRLSSRRNSAASERLKNLRLRLQQRQRANEAPDDDESDDKTINQQEYEVFNALKASLTRLGVPLLQVEFYICGWGPLTKETKVLE